MRLGDSDTPSAVAALSHSVCAFHSPEFRDGVGCETTRAQRRGLYCEVRASSHVGKNNLAAHRLGKVLGGNDVSDKVIVTLRRADVFSPAPARADQAMPRLKHINHETGKAIVQAVLDADGRRS